MHAQGTAFTYQGRLNNSTNPAAGKFDLSFALYDAATAGTQQGLLLTNAATFFTNGLFTVTLDFGNQFPGAARWLEIGVRSNGVATAFTTLAPRQPLTPAPYATYATYAASAGGLFYGLTIQNNTNGSPNVVGGAANNYVASGVIGATISGGGAASDLYGDHDNTITAYFGTIGGGAGNAASGPFATVGGGSQNAASGNNSTVGGGSENYASGTYNTTVGGGYDNTASGDYSTIGGGLFNTVGGWGSTVGGGDGNVANGWCAIVGGGFINNANGQAAVVAGGSANTASGDYSIISGGTNNIASGQYSTVSGGNGNNANGQYAAIPGGNGNSAAGDFSFAGGNHASAPYQGDFVWADDNGGNFAATGINQFAVRASGGVLLAANIQMGTTNSSDYHNFALGGGNSFGYLYGSYPKWGDGVHLGYNYYADASGAGHVANTAGATSRISADYGEVVLAVGAVNTAPSTVRVDATLAGVTVYGTFNNSSDRNAKQDFAPVSSAAILDKVLRLPVSEWSYKTDATTRHIGPMGQDFHATFSIGTDEKHIAPIDEGGIAFAAIQGLNQKVEQKDAKIKELEARIEKLEQLMTEKLGGTK